MRKLFVIFALLITGILIWYPMECFAKDIPWHHSQAKYFYVFGPDGDPLLGADDNEFTLYIDVPKNETSDLLINVYDPDTTSSYDFRTDPSNPWDTVTEFAVYGRVLIEKKEFSDETYNRKYYAFGPYPKEQGEELQNAYRFRVTAKTLKGDDANLFRFVISPDNAEAFSKNITLRLLLKQGDKMFFYPEIPADTRHIVLANYDLDKKGGSSEVFAGTDMLFGESKSKINVEDSLSGEWKKTQIPVDSTTSGRLKYVITKGTQKYAHAGIKVYDENGEMLPIYFEQGSAPVPVVKGKPAPKAEPVKAVARPVKDLGCNKFIFDATDSYDITNRKLSFFWEFGDGNTSTLPVVTHVYEKGGSYTVKLTVTDDTGSGCDTASTTQAVRVNTPPKADFSAPKISCVNDDIRFDASGTTDDTSKDISYVWDFGDGTKGQGKVITKKYAKGGTYKAALLVDDNENSSCSTDSMSKVIRVNTPPIANAGSDIDICLEDFNREYKVALDGSASSDADNDKLEYIWNLGDGSQKEGMKITHTYQKAGRYNVTLTVDDGSGSACSISEDSIVVDLNKSPVADIKTKDSKICVGDEVIFDGSGSVTEEGENLTYTWEFGDGKTADGVKVTHVYEKGGRYYPRLSVNDKRGTRCSESIATVIADVNTPPYARIDGPRIVCIGKSVTFDGSMSKDADNDPLKYYWAFDDEQPRSGSQKASYVFKTGGVHSVRLVVDDGRGYECSRGEDVITVRANRAPVAKANTIACCVGEKAYFDGSLSSDPDGDRLVYIWDFGDGSKGEGVETYHVYEKPGNYKVTLTVTDNSGTDCGSDSTVITVPVNVPPVPIIKVR